MREACSDIFIILLIIIILMKIKQIINKFLCEMDLFSAVPMLRTRSDPYFGTLGLGILSLLIYAFMTWLFFRNVVDAANLSESQL